MTVPMSSKTLRWAAEYCLACLLLVLKEERMIESMESSARVGGIEHPFRVIAEQQYSDKRVPYKRTVLRTTEGLFRTKLLGPKKQSNSPASY